MARYWAAMSEVNVELHYRSIAAVNRRDLEAFLALMDTDVEAVSRIVAVEGGLRGHDGIRHWWNNWFESFPDYTIEVIGMRDLGDVTIATLSAVGHGAGSDLPFEDNVWLASRWRRGKCVWWQVFRAEAEALEAAELRE
jgi:ketosteroid isomerase-like protein